MSAMCRPSTSATSRTRAAAVRCVWWSPWEKLRRATSLPAWIIALSTCGELLEGPSVHTILVRRTALTRRWSTSRVFRHAAPHLLFGGFDPPLQLQRADHGASNPSHQVGLEPVCGRHRDQVLGGP